MNDYLRTLLVEPATELVELKTQSKGRRCETINAYVSNRYESVILDIRNPIAVSIDMWEASVPGVGMRLTDEQVDALLAILMAAREKRKDRKLSQDSLP